MRTDFSNLIHSDESRVILDEPKVYFVAHIGETQFRDGAPDWVNPQVSYLSILSKD